MHALDPIDQVSTDAPAFPAEASFAQNVEGMIRTMEHLAVIAAHAEEPCAAILFSAANLLRVSVLEALR
jgi:hypothetical protein